MEELSTHLTEDVVGDVLEVEVKGVLGFLTHSVKEESEEMKEHFVIAVCPV